MRGFFRRWLGIPDNDAPAMHDPESVAKEIAETPVKPEIPAFYDEPYAELPRIDWALWENNEHWRSVIVPYLRHHWRYAAYLLVRETDNDRKMMLQARVLALEEIINTPAMQLQRLKMLAENQFAAGKIVPQEKRENEPILNGRGFTPGFLRGE